MQKIRLKTFLSGIVGIFACTTYTSAQDVAAPELTIYNFNDQSCIMSLSDNGNWAVSYGVSSSDGTRNTNARLINTRTKEVTTLGLENDEASPLACEANDVSDDGIAVGAYKGQPAVWSKADGWRYLEKPAGWTDGDAQAVTPDGRYAVGRMTNFTNGYKEYPVLWDITTLKIVETPNSPTVGSNNEPALMIRYTGISSDARYITGIVDYSYTWNTMNFIYDRETETWSRPGFNADGTPWADGISSMDGSFSPDGKWFGGTAYIIKDAASGNEYNVPCRYNMETKEFVIYEETEMQGIERVMVDNAGTLYAATPSGTPIRSLYVRVGKFWYALDELLKQRYGFDFYGKSGYDNTGTCMGVSGDGMTITAFPDPYKSYVLEMNESFAEAAANVNLLADYTATPDNGTSLTKIKSVSVTFSRNVKVIGSVDDIQFKDENGNSVGKVLSFEIAPSSPKAIRIGFRTTTLEDGKSYTLTIPAGTIVLSADETKANDEIKINYTGREAAPVKVTAVSPESGTALTQLNVTTNPILVTFDTNIAKTDDANASLYREGDDAPIATLSIADKGNQILIYPETTEYLYLNTRYKVVLGAGSVTDTNGDNPNEQYEINYDGLYERTIVADDTLMYKEDFSYGVASMLLYDGDKNIPNEEMAGYDFQVGDNYAWVPVRDDNASTDFAAASTSAYSPAGKSDDWMVTPQIYIPDAKCRLEFQAQGFRKAKEDKLKVIVYASEKVLNYLSETDVNDIRANGEVIMDEVVLPGINEDVMEGDWTTYSFKLDKYAKKNIYVAFVNENYDQSLVFVDNIKVIRDNGFLTALTSATNVIRQESQKITGRVIGNSDEVTFNTLNAKLLDANKNLVDEIAVDGLALAKGDRYDFTFDKELPLTIGESNAFYIRVQLDESFDTLGYAIKNLAFQPVKRVVVEEMTGQDCGNCPLGHLAMENLESIYGDRVLPLCYHVYTGDNYESGMSNYVNSFLGLSGAPSAIINRNGLISPPMYDNLSNGKHTYTYTAPDGSCWFDQVQKEFDTDAEADLSIQATYNENTQKVSVPCTVKFALNESNRNVGLFVVVAEDGLTGFQHNYFYNTDYEGLGEWTIGGIYAERYVLPYVFHDVVRAQVGTYFGTTGYIPTSIESGKEYVADITFNLPEVNDIYNCKIVCMMIDANTGQLINSARAKVEPEDTNGIDEAGVSDSKATEAARYNAAGQTISAPQKGLNIIRMSDGTSRKVIVK